MMLDVSKPRKVSIAITINMIIIETQSGTCHYADCEQLLLLTESSGVT